jgi:hypothetical protein
MNAKEKKNALKSALSQRVKEGKLVLLNDLAVDEAKTKALAEKFTGIGVDGKALLVDSLDNANLILSSRNIQKTKVTNSFGLNIYDIIYHEKLLISKTAVEELNRLLDPGKENGHGDTEVDVETKPKAKKEAKPRSEEPATEKKAAVKKEAKPKATAVKGEKKPRKEVKGDE